MKTLFLAIIVIFMATVAAFAAAFDAYLPYDGTTGPANSFARQVDENNNNQTLLPIGPMLNGTGGTSAGGGMVMFQQMP
jgi:hypothetical protein